jgi:hypothetical protein
MWAFGGIEARCAQLIGEASCGRRRAGRAGLPVGRRRARDHRVGEVACGSRLGGTGCDEARDDRRPGDGVFACDERGQVGSAPLPRQRPDLDDE